MYINWIQPLPPFHNEIFPKACGWAEEFKPRRYLGKQMGPAWGLTQLANKGLIRPYEGKPMVNKPLIRPLFLGVVR